MRLALALSGSSIATVCDFARTLWVVEADGGRVIEENRIELHEDDPGSRAARIAGSGATVLLCGCLSRDLIAALAPQGLRVISQQQGEAEAVVADFLAQRPLVRPCLRRRRRRGRGWCREHGDQSNATPSVHTGETMLIAISNSAWDAKAPVDPRFGRARCFTVFDDQGEGGSTYDNPHADGQHGAGIRAAEFVLGLGAQVVISGDVGPKALAVLTEGGCACYAAESGTVSEALEAWKAGSLRRIDL